MSQELHVKPTRRRRRRRARQEPPPNLPPNLVSDDEEDESFTNEDTLPNILQRLTNATATEKRICPTPVHTAAWRGYCRDLKLLFRLDPDTKDHINTANSEGNTPLHLSTMVGRKGVAVARLLFLHGADMCRINNKGLAPVDITQSFEKIVQPHQSRYFNYEKFPLACEIGHLPLVTYLEPRTDTYERCKGFARAVRCNQLEIVAFLATQSNTPLNDSDWCSVFESRNALGLVRCLVDAGADFSTCPLNRAIARCEIPVVQLLLDNVSKNNAAKIRLDNAKDVDMMKFLRNKPVRWNRAAFWRAVSFGDVDFVQRLCEDGAHVDIRLQCNGKSVLHLAAQQGSVRMIRLLMAYGADLSAIDSKKRNIVRLACKLLREKSSNRGGLFQVIVEYWYRVEWNLDWMAGLRPCRTVTERVINMLPHEYHSRFHMERDRLVSRIENAICDGSGFLHSDCASIVITMLF